MSTKHHRGDSAPMQSENTHFNGSEVIAALQTGGGIFPMAGRYSAKVWAIMLGCNVNTIFRYVRVHDIPYRQPGGGEMIIDANDFWTRLDPITPSAAGERRGGKRKKEA